MFKIGSNASGMNTFEAARRQQAQTSLNSRRSDGGSLPKSSTPLGHCRGRLRYLRSHMGSTAKEKSSLCWHKHSDDFSLAVDPMCDLKYLNRPRQCPRGVEDLGSDPPSERLEFREV